MNSLLDLVSQNRIAVFQNCDGTYLRYRITGTDVEFPIPLEDTKGGYFANSMKAITLMRWIRKHLENLAEAAKESPDQKYFDAGSYGSGPGPSN